MLSQNPRAFVSAPFQKGDGMKTSKLHYGWIVISMGLLTTIASHGFGRMSYTIILPAMKDGLQFNYTQLGLLGTGNFLGYLAMAIIGGFMASRFGTRLVITLAVVLMGITMILTGLAQSFGFAFAMRLMTGQTHNQVSTRAYRAAGRCGQGRTGNRSTKIIRCISRILVSVRDYVVGRMAQEGSAYTVVFIVFANTR